MIRVAYVRSRFKDPARQTGQAGLDDIEITVTNQCDRPVGTGCRFTVFRGKGPAVERFATDQIGNAQWFDRAGKGEVREVLDQQKGEVIGVVHTAALTVIPGSGDASSHAGAVVTMTRRFRGWLPKSEQCVMQDISRPVAGRPVSGALTARPCFRRNSPLSNKYFEAILIASLVLPSRPSRPYLRLVADLDFLFAIRHSSS